jgi:hypothetical protein
VTWIARSPSTQHGPARSGDGYFNGVTSNHLASSMEGSTQFAFVRKPTIPFRPPTNPHLPIGEVWLPWSENRAVRAFAHDSACSGRP